MLAAGESGAAVDQLCSGSPLLSEKPQALAALKSQITAYLPLYGAVLGHELVMREEFGASLVRLVYLLKLEEHPLVWEFFFYRPADSWKLSHVVFVDQFQLLMKRGA